MLLNKSASRYVCSDKPLDTWEYVYRVDDALLLTGTGYTTELFVVDVTVSDGVKLILPQAEHTAIFSGYYRVPDFNRSDIQPLMFCLRNFVLNSYIYK